MQRSLQTPFHECGCESTDTEFARSGQRLFSTGCSSCGGYWPTGKLPVYLVGSVFAFGVPAEFIEAVGDHYGVDRVLRVWVAFDLKTPPPPPPPHQSIPPTVPYVAELNAVLYEHTFEGVPRDLEAAEAQVRAVATADGRFPHGPVEWAQVNSAAYYGKTPTG